MGNNKKIAMVTGAGGLVGSETVKLLIEEGYYVFGIDNNMRSKFFGEAGSVESTLQNLIKEHPLKFCCYDLDIRNQEKVESAFGSFSAAQLIVHAAAQPSHDWAAKEPHVDFGVNALGTLNVVEAARKYSPTASFCHVSTSKVYGDTPNRLPLYGAETRFLLPDDHQYKNGIDTTMSIDQSLHSLFGVSKASGDLIVQEYGKYFGMPTICFRPGCITGAAHAGVELHGFLSYLMKCAISGKKYTIYGYDGLQVRCNIYARDLARCFLAFHENPSSGEVYNIGGGVKSSISMLEAIDYCEQITGKDFRWIYDSEARIGDHKWWISDIEDFSNNFDWQPEVSDCKVMLEEIYEAHK